MEDKESDGLKSKDSKKNIDYIYIIHSNSKFLLTFQITALNPHITTEVVSTNHL